MTEYRHKNGEDCIVVNIEQLDIPFVEIYGDGDNYMTPREFILEAEDDFNISHKDIDNMNKNELNDYIDYLDDLRTIDNKNYDRNMEILDAILEFDHTCEINIIKEETGYKIEQTLKDGTAGIMLFIPFNLEDGFSFNHGWKMDKEYLGGVSDVIIKKMKQYNIPASIDGNTLFRVSKSFKQE